MKVSIIGASGYTGGELLRLLVNHPEVTLDRITSESNAGSFVHMIHPNLRGFNIKFSSIKESFDSDLVFFCLPHGVSMDYLREFYDTGVKIIDLGADLRLKDKDVYKSWYGLDHKCPELLEKAVYGIPEIHREEIKKTKLVANPGCIATSMIMALYPLRHLNIDKERIVIDSKIGSSASGDSFSASSHHPERSRAIRCYSPIYHRHIAEVEQETGFKVTMAPHAIEMVRGIFTTIYLFLNQPYDEKEIRGIYRDFSENNKFFRVVKQKKGIYRHPDPKILTGSNFCEVGFELDRENRRMIVFSAIDNLMKGAAGAAVQNMNIMYGLEEDTGLKYIGYHPI
ncbi:MAG: Malonyl-CoA reductase [Candidatus Methanofastidiosum methylothiophilum]|uniref:Putative [LysW]-L-2-aminoadipate/[LysW]-L-glutamate phosphate reductase n=1 Tax=Candidatus Methanofastidiosum methylothiophilum TaxID=1705564 RepID=A0A150IL60_9EURY|nr:MAG: Malonyl-CoA reductase [Candidatus Methanofastidiosum methylthiophilus]KYC47383.1 MAG: Malonyl-CoA reductase [Candidatus Methanofastidiosum methylthiophilus]KYC49876.1 MAG: Malonyl-CoA reductase [Candidatus Methanofastidiosum methylthiophilus]